VDIAYLNILGTFDHLCWVLDGASRASFITRFEKR